MYVKESKNECSGCTACMNACPSICITMTEDEEGFLYPLIDENLCTNCDLCRKVCRFKVQSERPNRDTYPIIYAAKNKNVTVRMKSSSGGAYTAISDYFLENGGYVFGAAFVEDFKVSHTKAKSVEERDSHRGSKYVQSNLNDIFKEIKLLLKDNNKILFTGTACQVSGLNSYLARDYENLFTLDVVCYGTLSPKLFSDYIAAITKNKKLKEYYFREKKISWRGINVSAVYVDGTYICNNKKLNVIHELYSKNFALRPSCHNCYFTNLNRVSDMTLGDYWGIEDVKPDFDDSKGVSVILINTPKGKIFFENIKEKFDLLISNAADCTKKQPRLSFPTEQSPIRKEFWHDYSQKGFKFIVRKYTSLGKYTRFGAMRLIKKTIFFFLSALKK